MDNLEYFCELNIISNIIPKKAYSDAIEYLRKENLL
jgi:hypothetical protein